MDSTSAPPGKSFSLALIFDNLTMIYLGMVFFAFDSFSFLDLCFCFHNVWDISALFLQTFFFVPISFYFSWDSNYICFRLCACFCFFFFLTWITETYSSFVFLVFFFSSHFIVLSSNSLVLYFLVSIVSSFNGFLQF